MATPQLEAAAASTRTEQDVLDARMAQYGREVCQRIEALFPNHAPRIVHKNCPFCGAAPPLSTQNRFGQFQVGCEADECPVNPQCSDKTLGGAWAKWNARSI